MQIQDTLDYLVSQGFSHTIVQRFWKRVKKTEDCWLWEGALAVSGHGSIGLGPEGSTRIGTNRLSWIIHYGPIPDGLHVLHRCDNPPCVRPDHLFIGTHQDNIADMVAKGRQTKGMDKPLAKLTDDNVAEILKMGRNVTRQEMAHRFGITASTISQILNGELWKHVRPDLPRFRPRGYGNTRLSESDVMEIIRLGGSCTQRELGERFGIGQVHVSEILLGKTWKHLPR